MYKCGQRGYNPAMKLNSVFLALTLAAVASPLAHSQTKPSATPASTVAKLPTLEQWQDEQIKSAAKDFQLAQEALTQAQTNVDTAKRKLLQVVNEVGVARHLNPAETQFNFQTLQFETHPAPVAAPTKAKK